MQLFYAAHTGGDTAILDVEETRHCKVLRKNPGDVIQVINGQGLLLDCSIMAIKKDSVDLSVSSSRQFPRSRPYYFHLLIAPTKQNERMEWMLEKAIEAGLDEISFIETTHSEKTRVNMSRLDRIAISALKQSGQYYLPKINAVTEIGQVLVSATTFIAHCNPGEKIKLSDAFESVDRQGNIQVLIGPEGDFSVPEVKSILDKGAQAISLGNSRLRTETAGIYCAMVLNALS